MNGLRDFSQLKKINTTIAQSLKFYVHLMGDFHQPLHLSSFKRGGNNVKFQFFKRKSNLHTTWDSLIINRRIKEDFDGNRKNWLSYLKTISFEDDCRMCIDKWAEDIIQINCSLAYQKMDIGDYYEKAKHVIDRLIVKAAKRIAVQLDYLFENKLHFNYLCLNPPKVFLQFQMPSNMQKST